MGDINIFNYRKLKILRFQKYDLVIFKILIIILINVIY